MLLWTELRYTGSVDNNILNGALYLVGGGDPLLSIANLFSLAEDLKNKGVTKINGNFYYDDSKLIRLEKINYLQADEFPYNSSVSALSVEFNRFNMFWKTKDGETTSYAVPNFAYDKLTLAEQQQNDDFIYQGSDIWIVSDQLKKRGRKTLPIKNPALLTAQLFKFYANLLGIEVAQPKYKIAPTTLKLLATHQSPELAQIVRLNMNYSNNLVSELLLLSTANKLAGRPVDSIAAAIAIVKNWYKQHIPSINWSKINWQNGSGLSAKTTITPEQMLHILRFADSKQYNDHGFFTYLPASGIRGTLKKRFTRPELALRIWAKTGTMYFVNSLSGYMFTDDGKKYLFVIFINDKHKRRLIDSELTVDRYNSLTGQAGAWGGRALNLQQDILYKWINNY